MRGGGMRAPKDTFHFMPVRGGQRGDMRDEAIGRDHFFSGGSGGGVPSGRGVRSTFRHIDTSV